MCTDLALVSEETVSSSLELDVTLTGGSLFSWLVVAVGVDVSFLSFMIDLGMRRHDLQSIQFVKLNLKIQM